MEKAVPAGPVRGYDRILDDVYFLLESPANHNRARKFIIYFIAAMILLNVAVVILETVEPLYIKYEGFFSAIDLVCVIVFTIEYSLRVWCCVKDPRYASPVRGRIRYMLTPYALVDLVALTPFYLPLIIPVEFRLLRMLRLLRIFRVLRLGRYSSAFETFATVLRAKKEELVITVVMALIVLVIASSGMYLMEREAQPETFASIPDAMWWAVVTLATVGYGDTYPVTAMGKVLAGIVALSAIGLFALPAGIVASGFAESVGKNCHSPSDEPLVCPKCGARIDPKTGREAGRAIPPDSGPKDPDSEEILEEILR